MFKLPEADPAALLVGDLGNNDSVLSQPGAQLIHPEPLVLICLGWHPAIHEGLSPAAGDL